MNKTYICRGDNTETAREMLITLCVIRIILCRLFAYLGRRGRRPLQPYFTYSLTKYIKYGALYKTDNLVFYSLKRKYHLRLSDMLLGFGCEIMQGYYFSKPVPVSEYENILKNYHFAE